MSKNRGVHEGLSRVHNLELDGRTQEVNLGTLRLRTTLGEPSTPEMPDLSCITQDICKVCEIIFNQVIVTSVVADQVYVLFYFAASASSSSEKQNHDGCTTIHLDR